MGLAAAPPHAAADCFHCGLPVPPGADFTFEASGGWRAFCCAGCEAVARIIGGQGLDDYYRVRTAPSPRPEDDPAAADVALYDEPAVQSTFVRDAADGTREALLVIEGIRCAACAWLVEQAALRVRGVLGMEVNAATRQAWLRFDPSAAKLSAVLGAIRAVGYRARPLEEGVAEDIERRERRAILRRLWVAGLGMMQVMMYAVPAYLAADGEITPDVESLMRWAGFALTAPVMAYSAAPFFRGAWRDLRGTRAGMDVPVALGLAVAFAASAWATLRGTGAVYFDSVTMFVFLLLGGRYMEHLAHARAARALDRIAGLAPQGAWRLGSAGDIVRIAAARLRPGDRVRVRAGEALPADGVLESASATVSEALLSGESRTLERSCGQGLLGGAVNAGDAFEMRVTEVGAASVLGGIRASVQRAAAARPRWAQAAERASHIFVVLILVTSALAGLAWLAIDPARALGVAVAVLVVTCPCALALATPVAMTAAAGALARRNLVATAPHAIEALAGATDIVFDKTGTLTRGAPVVIDVVPLGDLDRERCLAFAEALARHSSHPIDRAFAAGASRERLEATDHHARPGAGAQASIQGRHVRIGRAAYAGSLHRKPAPIAWIDAHDTVVWLADDRGWLAAFRIGDALRPGAREAVDALRRRGVNVHLLTGDEPGVARRVAGQLGIANVEARADPERKRAYVQELQARGARVAMVGDGINDAPVLAQADVSVAMGSGADLARMRADAVLLSDSLADLDDALGAARRARAVIGQNLGWALAYNAIAIPLALAGMVTPLIAGIGMSTSSLVVVANAMRLR